MKVVKEQAEWLFTKTLIASIDTLLNETIILGRSCPSSHPNSIEFWAKVKLKPQSLTPLPVFTVMGCVLRTTSKSSKM